MIISSYHNACRAGERAAVFVGPVPEDKLPKDATAGRLLSGAVCLAKLGAGASSAAGGRPGNAFDASGKAPGCEFVHTCSVQVPTIVRMRKPRQPTKRQDKAPWMPSNGAENCIQSSDFEQKAKALP